RGRSLLGSRGRGGSLGRLLRLARRVKDVLLADPPTDAGAGQRVEVDLVLGRELAHQRGHIGADVTTALRRRADAGGHVGSIAGRLLRRGVTRVLGRRLLGRLLVQLGVLGQVRRVLGRSLLLLLSRLLVLGRLVLGGLLG